MILTDRGWKDHLHPDVVLRVWVFGNLQKFVCLNGEETLEGLPNAGSLHDYINLQVVFLVGVAQ